MTVDALREYGLEEMNDEEISNLLRNKGYGVLGLPTQAAPYLIPLSFGYDGESALYFSYFVGEQSRKETLSQAADTATVLVFSPDSVFSWESVSLIGSINEIPESEWDDHESALDNAWHLQLFEKAQTAGTLKLFQFEIEQQVGFKSVGLPPGMEGENLTEDAE